VKGAWPVRVFGYLLTAVLLMGVAGCTEAEKQADPQAVRIASLERENADLSEQNENITSDNTSLRENIKVLSGLPDKASLDDLCPVESVGITKITGFYDKDDDGTRESLVVYVQPVDTVDDAVKAAGAMDVELWDLGREPDGARLGQWRVGPEELRKMWFSTWMRTNYRLTFESPASAEDLDKPLTVKITFTDYTTGRVFQEQYVIEREDN